jgi:hypothetical protein
MLNFQKVSEWLRGALKLPQTTAPSTQKSQLPPSPLPPNTIQKAQNKRQRTLQILQQARDCKAQKRDAEQEATNWEALFWDGVDDAVDKESKEELYVMAMKRIDQGWKYTDLSSVTGSSYRTLRSYHEVWVQENDEERFRFHVEHKKRGRAVCDPLSLLHMKEINRKIVRDENCQLVATQRLSYENVVLPVLKQEREAKGKNSLVSFMPSKSSIWRAIKAILPVAKGTTKKSIKNRHAARQSPFGGMSFVAMYPQLIDGIAIDNLYFIDSVPVVLFDPSKQQDRAYMTQEVSDSLKAKRRAPKSQDAGGQKRGLKVNINMAGGAEALVGGTALICDHVIKEITRIPLTPTVDVMFAPYCAADEASGPAAQNLEGQESLDVRINYVLYNECIIPKILLRMERLMQWATANNLDAGMYSKARTFQDGEAGPLRNIMLHFAAELRDLLIKLYFAKLPNALTGEVQIGDRTGAHPLIHAGFASDEFKNMTEDTVAQIARSMPGVRKALDFLATSGISAAGQASYRRAIAFLPKLLQRSVTPGIVLDALKNTGYQPFSPAIMLTNMWDQFEDLSTAEANEVIRIAETEIRAITVQKGEALPSEIQEALERSEVLAQTIEFPEVRENFDALQWNRHLSMDLSHADVIRNVMQREQAELVAAAAMREVQLEAAEIKRRANLRYDHCFSSECITDKRTLQHTCKCGGKFSNGLTGFKAHENSAVHQGRFPAADWDAFYARHPATQNVAAPAAAPAPALAPVVVGSPRQVHVSPRRLTRSPGSFINGQYVAPSWLRVSE